MRPSILVTLLFTVPVFAQEATWLTKFEEAKALAAKENKFVLADFTGSDWCGWCIKLKEEVFSKPEFATWAKDNVVLLELDFPRNTELPAELKEQNDKLAAEYKIEGYPTILLLDATGAEIARLGYAKGGPAAWTKKADEALAAAKAKAELAKAWTTDYEAALARAKKEKKYVIADFTGSDWCGWCIKLKEEVFDKPEFHAWAKDNAVLLELDFPRNKELPEELKKQNEKLRERFKIRGYPTILFLDASGKELGRGGYVEGGPAAWIAAAEKQSGVKSKKPKDAKKK
ncbi:MAG: thioredoxin family protein [Planctomycetes bacterium]|nr:thioredoxin family protein [Planctomycetota bacterium]